jgi:hypothetical protein
MYPHFTNDEFASIYDYLQGHISKGRLGVEIKKSRTNTYYYLGRAFEYWLSIGVVQFANITDQKELGGKDVEEKE